tara:strand:- start:331 stop:669 length:339 start_codon:yes stop_codon:yes gene_type:complete
MFKIKILFSIILFSFLLIGTSTVKNQTRELEKNISNLNLSINQKEKDLFETQLDFSYLTAPVMIEKKIEILDNDKYFPMDFSKIYLSITNFINIQNKIVTQKRFNEKKIQNK